MLYKKYMNKKIIIFVATHGDEKNGLYVKKELNKKFKKHPVKNGTVDFVVANPLALKRGVRFIETDLNRSFPGNAKGSHEEKIAAKLYKLVGRADIAIDIHSTKSALKNALIVTKYDKKTREVVNMVKPENLLIMEVTRNTALISNAKIGIAFEYGKDRSAAVVKKVSEDITRLLIGLNMVELNQKERKIQTKVFRVYDTFPKKIGEKLSDSIKNYCKVKKGSIVAKGKDYVVRAKEDFYPILFGKRNYREIFGFIANLE